MFEYSSPYEIGMGGHYSAIDGSSLKLMSQLKDVEKKISGCPINYKAKTYMPEQTFRKMCLAFQRKAGLIAPPTTERHSDIVGGVFKSKNKTLCSKCRAGKSVRDQRRICELPTNIFFDESLLPDK